MSGRRKLLLGALAVLLVALFALAVGVGGGTGRADRPPAVVSWLGRLTGGAATVDPATVAADCGRTGDVLTFVGECPLRVADPGGLKTLVLRSPAAFGVTAPAPRGADLTVHDTVEPGDDAGAVAKVAVDRPVTVLISCPGGAGCAVTVAAS
ncbi:hypothetical protein ACFY3U_18670 [Micromonospora sp. NPDC000089]|uniref:hypothetical protein n=1 Tax=unclassified Micromonospora TaxID=2617518 RepID=UPI0036793862